MTLDTSAAAYAAIQPHIPSIREDCVDYFERQFRRDEGFTILSTTEATGRPSKSISPMFAPWEREGMIVKTGKVIQAEEAITPSAEYRFVPDGQRIPVENRAHCNTCSCFEAKTPEPTGDDLFR